MSETTSLHAVCPLEQHRVLRAALPLSFSHPTLLRGVRLPLRKLELVGQLKEQMCRWRNLAETKYQAATSRLTWSVLAAGGVG